jgi:hypothetical protein
MFSRTLDFMALRNQYGARKTTSIWVDVLNQVVLLKKLTVKQFANILLEFLAMTMKLEAVINPRYTQVFDDS